MKKIYLFVVAFLFILPMFGQKNTYLSFTKNQKTKTEASYPKEANPSQPLREITKLGNRIKVSYNFTGAFVSDKNLEEKGNWNFLHIKGFNKLGLPGKPALPVHNDIFTVNENCAIKITKAKYIEYSNYNIHPALEPERDTEGAKPSEFILDRNVYENNAFFPEKIVEITSVQKYRGNPFATVRIQPVQFNPVTKTIRVYSIIEYEVVNSTISNSLQNLENKSTNILQPATLNLEGEDQRDDATTQATKKPYYIIIAQQSYSESVKKLASWKAKLGYEVEIKMQEKWTSDQVKGYLHKRYAEMPNKPEYFVIIGDHEQVPAETLIRSDSDGNHPYASDLYYACMDGKGDYTPDMGHGRISVKSPEQAVVVINKIINYEKNPVADASFYKNGLNCAQFQDVQSSEAADGYAARRFCHTSEEIRNYVSGRGYDVTRIYYTKPTNHPTNWNNGYYSNGEPIPNELLRKNGFNWDGNATDIKREINEGKFYVFHRDHGYAGGIGWAHPEFLTSNVKELTNGEKLPVVFSMNCHTGEFMLPEAFAEAFLRQKNGGAVGVVAAAYYSLSGYNDGLSIGMVDAIWSDPGIRPKFGRGGNAKPTNLKGHKNFTYNMGDVLNQGLIRMRETWGGDENSILYTHRLFHYFGDPAMRIWTKKPEQITATYSKSLKAGSTSLAIENISAKEVLVTLVQDNKIIAFQKTTGTATSANLTFKAITNEHPVYVTISKHNAAPLSEQVKITGDTHKPVAKFVVNNNNPTIVQYAGKEANVTITDKSTFQPTSWKWDFSPATVTFKEGTTKASQNPIVAFNNAGEYSVTLTATNANGNNQTTTTVKVITPTAIACKPETRKTKDYNMGIHQFQLGNINNRTASSLKDSPKGYMDFVTSQIADLKYGREYEFSVLLDHGGGIDPQNLKMFIDYNNNGTFESTELVYHTEKKGETVTGKLQLPNTVAEENIGKVLRLRLIADYYKYPITDACYSPAYGQVEDYGIRIVKSTPVVNLTDINTITFSGATITSKVSSNGGSALSEYGILFSENKNPVVENSTKLTSTNITNGSYKNIITGLDQSKVYYVKAFATNEKGSTYSTVQQFRTFGAEPKSHPTELKLETAASSLLQFSWKDASDKPEPWGYLIKISKTSFDDITAPVDGTVEADNEFCLNVKQGIQKALFKNLSENTTYFVKIYPYSNSGKAIDYKTDGTVSKIEAKTLAFGKYWTSTHEKTFNIDKVEFNTINNSTTRKKVAGSYYNFTTQSTDVKPNFTYELKINVNPGGNYRFSCFAWVDWNHNGLFDSSETYDLGLLTGPRSCSKEILIPTGAVHGKTTMRVIYQYVGNSNPVPALRPYNPHFSRFGSTEDYSINVNPNAKIAGYWDGSESTDWNNPLNWDNEKLPTNKDKVVIPGKLTNYPVLATKGTGKLITIAKGASLTVKDGANLNITDKISVTSGANFTVDNGNVSTGNLEILGRFTQNNGKVTLAKIFTEIGSFVQISNGTLNASTWARSEASSWSKGTINFLGGQVNISGDVLFSGSSAAIKMDGDFQLNVGDSFLSGSNWDVTGGTITMKATPGKASIFANAPGSTQIINNLVLSNPKATYFLNRGKAGDESGLLIKGNLTIAGKAYSDTDGVCNTKVVIEKDLVLLENAKLFAGKTPIEVKGNVTSKGEFSENTNIYLTGTKKQSIKANAFANLTVKNAQGVDLLSNTIINGTLDIRLGILNVADFTLNLQNTARINDTDHYSNKKMIALGAKGAISKTFKGANPNEFCFPIGDLEGSVDFTPVKLDLNYTDDRTKTIVLKMSSTKVGDDNTDYLKRHWILEDQSNDKDLSANLEVNFVASDITGDKNKLAGIIEKNSKCKYTHLTKDENKIVFKKLSQLGKVYTSSNIFIAIAGENQVVQEGETVQLSGSAFCSSASRSFTYHWTGPDGIKLSNCDIANPTFVAPTKTKNSEYEFTLVANNGVSNSLPAKVKIIVNHKNVAPVANAGNNIEIEEGKLVTLDASASSDFENADLTYTWTAPKGITLSDVHAMKPTFTAAKISSGTELEFSLVVSDGELESKPATVKVTVLIVTAINDITDNDFSIQLYPNPTSDIFYVKMNKQSRKENIITIMDMSGKVVSNVKSSEKTIPFQLNLKPGIYIVKVQSENNIKVQKLVVQ
jgi:PKD repeat protein